MAGDWIKMRGSLMTSPKLIRVARALHDEREFRDWLTPGGGGPMNGQIVSDHALRSVTLALLCVTWSASREHGRFVGNDLFLEGLTIDDLDNLAGVHGVGAAMESVGWAVESEGQDGVTLPNFKEYNVPKDAAERMRDHRASQTSRNIRATSAQRNAQPDQSINRVDDTVDYADHLEALSDLEGNGTAQLAHAPWAAKSKFVAACLRLVGNGIPEHWFHDAVNAVKECRPAKPVAYFRKVLTTKAAENGADLDALLAAQRKET